MSLAETLRGCRVALHHGEIGIALDDHLFRALEKECRDSLLHIGAMAVEPGWPSSHGEATTIHLDGKRYFRGSHVRAQ